MIFVFNDTATTEIYTLSLHDALPIFGVREEARVNGDVHGSHSTCGPGAGASRFLIGLVTCFATQDRKSTRLNSSHANISYAVFCLIKNPLFTVAFSKSPLSSSTPLSL